MSRTAPGTAARAIPRAHDHDLLPSATDSKADIKRASIAKQSSPTDPASVSRVATRLVVSPRCPTRPSSDPTRYPNRRHFHLAAFQAKAPRGRASPDHDGSKLPRVVTKLHRGWFEPFAGGVHGLFGGSSPRGGSGSVPPQPPSTGSPRRVSTLEGPDCLDHGS